MLTRFSLWGLIGSLLIASPAIRATDNLAFTLSVIPVGTHITELDDERVSRPAFVDLTVAEGTALLEGGIGRITYTLLGEIQFHTRTLTPEDLVLIEADSDGAVIRVNAVTNGRVSSTSGAGDTEVTYELEAEDAGGDANNHVLEPGDVLRLRIPGLQELVATPQRFNAPRPFLIPEYRVEVSISAVSGAVPRFRSQTPLPDGSIVSDLLVQLIDVQNFDDVQFILNTRQITTTSDVIDEFDGQVTANINPDDRELVFGRADVILTVKEGTALSLGSSAEIRYTLNGAEFWVDPVPGRGFDLLNENNLKLDLGPLNNFNTFSDMTTLKSRTANTAVFTLTLQARNQASITFGHALLPGDEIQFQMGLGLQGVTLGSNFDHSNTDLQVLEHVTMDVEVIPLQDPQRSDLPNLDANQVLNKFRRLEPVTDGQDGTTVVRNTLVAVGPPEDPENLALSLSTIPLEVHITEVEDGGVTRPFFVDLAVMRGTALAETNIGRITYTLLGGVEFHSRRLRPEDIVLMEAGSDGAAIRVVSVTNGDVGDTEVTYELEALDAGADARDLVLEAGDILRLTIPGLQELEVTSQVVNQPRPYTLPNYRVEVGVTSITTRVPRFSGGQLSGNSIQSDALVRTVDVLNFDDVRFRMDTRQISLERADLIEAGGVAAHRNPATTGRPIVSLTVLENSSVISGGSAEIRFMLQGAEFWDVPGVTFDDINDNSLVLTATPQNRNNLMIDITFNRRTSNLAVFTVTPRARISTFGHALLPGDVLEFVMPGLMGVAPGSSFDPDSTELQVLDHITMDVEIIPLRRAQHSDFTNLPAEQVITGFRRLEPIRDGVDGNEVVRRTLVALRDTASGSSGGGGTVVQEAMAELPPGLDSGDLTFNIFTEPTVFASEIFGADDLVLGQNSMQVILTLNGGVTAGGVGELEFRLTGGAEFGLRRLDSSDLVFEEADGEGASNIIRLLSGGSVGSDRVTFEISAMDGGGDDLDRSLERLDRLVLTIPALQNLPISNAFDLTAAETPNPVGQVRVMLLSEPRRATSGFNFPLLEPLTDGREGNSISRDTFISVLDRFILTAEAPAGAAPTIDISNRTDFDTGAVTLSLFDGNETVNRQGIVLGNLAIAINSGTAGVNVRQPSGRENLELTSADRILVSVAGDVAQDDLVFIDLNSNQMLDSGERIPIGEALTLSAVAAGANTPLAEGEPERVYLLADGETELRPGSYTVSMLLDLSEAGYVDDRASSLPVTTRYSGIFQDGFAYGVPGCRQLSRARIRVTNETNSALHLFVQGLDQAGTDLGFAEVDVSLLRDGDSDLAPRETVVLSTAHLEQIFGLNDDSFGGRTCAPEDTWAGEAQLTFFSDGNITITSLVRGADGQLRDLGGFTGLRVDDGGSPQTLSK